MLEQITEEGKEIAEALLDYTETATEKNLVALKTEIGDKLFAIVCLANKKNISLEECFNLMMEKNRKRFKEGYKKEKK
jgi:NTP pyrophosphatase (non-canonical NTP hydrolase)